SSSGRFRKGPPEAVSTSESTVSAARPSRHWKTAECSLSIGRSRPPPRLHAARARSPAATRLSLFARASVTPRSRAQRVAPTPARPLTRSECQNNVERRRAGPEQGVQTVEHPSVAAQQPSRVLDAQVALHCRLEEVSADRSEDDRSTETEHLGDGEKLAAIL